MYDTALNEFFDRFGQPEAQRDQVQSVSSLKTNSLSFSKPELNQIDTSGLEMSQQNKIANAAKPQSKIGGLLGDAVGTLSESSGGSNAGFMNRYDYDPKLQNQMMAMEGVKDMAAQTNPWMAAGRAVEKGAKNIGTAMGGESGGDIASGIVDPFSGQLETLKSEDATDFEKGLTIAAPFLSGVIAGKARNRGRLRVAKEKGAKESYFEKKKREDEYRMAEGLDTLEAMKSQNKKQLGLLG